MQIPTVERCCCGLFDLITAGKILGVLALVGATLSILLGHSIIVNLIVIGVDGAWLYGIIKEKPNFMLAKVIVAPIAIVIVVLAALFLALFGPSEEIIKVEGSEIVEEKVSPWPFAIALLIVASIWSYFWIVCYSVYRLIKDKENESIPGENIPPKDEV